MPNFQTALGLTHAQKALRRAQLAAAGAAQASQQALFATLHRPPFERTASGRYLQPGLFENKVAQTRESQIDR